jgi:hypothetical protein
MDTFVNKVAESGIITLNLEIFLPKNMVIFDLKDHLFMGLILKEKDFRTTLQTIDWTLYQNKEVILTCSADAIIPVWAYMLVANYLQPVAQQLAIGNENEAKNQLLLSNIEQADLLEYTNQRVVIKGCGEIPIPESAYAKITYKLRPIAKSIMYGEPCSTVPIFKKKINL